MRKSTHTGDYSALRQRLALIRKEAELSQRQLAAALRVPHSWVAKVESGERRLDLVEFGWYCAACGASPATEAAALFKSFSHQSSPRRGRRA
jgi:transcriptional regulator with XRE-family HTH domain